MSNIKVALFCVCRNENLYIDEWVNHYLNIGIDHIYIVDNNPDNSLESICDKYKDVSLIDLRSKEKIPGFVTYQAHLYTALYNIYNIFYDWLCFFDIDEFLMLKKDTNIKDYLNRDIFENIDQIHMTWQTFGDNGHIYYEDKPVVERFTTVSTKYHTLYDVYSYGIKSIIRSRLDLHFHTCHTAISNTNEPLRTCDNSGILYDQQYSSHNVGNYEYASLNHYETKSTEEFLRKNSNDGIDTFIKKYFEVNEYTEEKNNIIKKLYDKYSL